MDCQKFEAAMTEELLGERDEIASATLRRHLAGCAACRAKVERLRAVRGVTSHGPLADRPVTLEDPILEPTGGGLRGVPSSKMGQPSSAAFARRFADGVSIAGNWAMRPETAMAALFLVMTGTSVLLLRGKSSRAPANAEITVTEEGSPAPSASSAPPLQAVALESAAATAATLAAPHPSERYPAGGQGLLAPVRSPAPSDDPHPAGKPPAPLPAPPGRPPLGAHDSPTDPSSSLMSPGAAGAGAAGAGPSAVVPMTEVAPPYAAALSAYQAGRFDDARRAFDALAPGDATAELWAARSVREERGCSAAIGRFDRLAQRATGTPPGWDALFEGGRCRVALGDYAGARSRFEALANVDAFRDRVQTELERITHVQQGGQRP